MKVILTKELKGKGLPGDVVDVSAGFVNNYLLPQGLAKLYTDENRHALRNADSKRDEKGAGQDCQAVVAIVEDSSGICSQSPAFADRGSLVLWVINALLDPELWQSFGKEGDVLRIVAAKGDDAVISDPVRAFLAEHEELRVSGAPAMAERPPRRRKPVEFPRSLRIAGRACARLARAFR